jgi:hypothetical protein
MNRAQAKTPPEGEEDTPLFALDLDASSSERAVARAFLIAMRDSRPVTSVEEFAIAAGFAVHEAPWTAYYGLSIALRRGLCAKSREFAIARGVALAMVDWVPHLSVAALEVEIRRLLTPNAIASVFSDHSVS